MNVRNNYIHFLCSGLKKKIAHTQISVPKVFVPILETACINPSIWKKYKKLAGRCLYEY